MLVRQRFGKEQDFLMKMNPNTRNYFGANEQAAVMGDYPTLNDLNIAYGKGFATEWLIPLIDVLSLETTASNPKERQQLELAELIATEYRHFKTSEILLFFYRFKAGRYGRFYGSFDPMVIACALRDFVRDRNNLIDYYEQQRREREREQRKPGVSWEEYCKMRGIVGRPSPTTGRCKHELSEIYDNELHEL